MDNIYCRIMHLEQRKRVNNYFGVLSLTFPYLQLTVRQAATMGALVKHQRNASVLLDGEAVAASRVSCLCLSMLLLILHCRD